MTGSTAQRVINSRALILKDGGVFYLSAAGEWYQAPDVGGPWTWTASPPASLDAAKQAAVASQSVDLMPLGTNAVTTMPAIFVSTTPDELIQTEGPANLVPIEGTDFGGLAGLAFIVLLCYGGGFGTMPAFAADFFGARNVGSIYGLMLTAWGFAGVLGPTLIAHLRQSTGYYTEALDLIAGIMLLSTALPFVIRPPKPSTHALPGLLQEHA